MFKVYELLEITSGKLILKGAQRPINGVSIDSRTIRKDDVFIAIKGNNFDGHDFVGEALKKGARTIIAMRYPSRVGRDSKANVILVKDTVKALGDIAHYHRRKFNIPIIAVTGSNGKTTVKELISCILEDKFKVLKSPGTQNNQIGIPMALLKMNKRFDLAVLEIGTNHFGEIEYLAKITRPNIGIITNIGPSHLEFLHSAYDVYREKYAIIKNLMSPFIGILNMDDKFLKQNASAAKQGEFIVGFGTKGRCDYKASQIRIAGSRVEFTVNAKYRFTLDTLGAYNVYNALTAISTVRLFGMDYETIYKRLANFVFPAGRLVLKRVDGVHFIDDTYNANPVSLERALEALKAFKVKGRKILVMGDMLELGTYSESFHRQAGKTIAGICDAFISAGKLTYLAAESARKSGMSAQDIFTCSSSKEARQILMNKLKPSCDDIVLVKGSRLMRMEEVIKEQ